MRGAAHASIDKQDVRHMTDADLTDLGVRLVSRKDVVFECRRCGESWVPQLDSSGRLPHDYWICPLKCNA